RRLRLCAGQSVDARADVRPGADDRPDRGRYSGAAREAQGCHGRAGARRRAAFPRQASRGHRLFDPRQCGARGEEVVRLLATLLVALTCAFPSAARAESKIEPIVSPGGIKAWLVRETTVPMVAVDFAFTGGANADPAEKPGVANMVGSLLDEGAGELD